MPIIPHIDLSHNGLNGPLTNLPSRGVNIDDDFEFFQPRLYLQNNIFNNSIPWSLCKRTDLVYLDLSYNKLTGKIPKCLKNLQMLIFLRLSSNELCGVIPSSIGHISDLLSLNLNDNNFTGEIPREIWNLRWLNFLDLGDNAFYGKIPEWIGEKIKSLCVFRLRNNNFSGEIPKSLCTNLDLRVLDVGHNNLTGTIPDCLGGLQGMVNNPSGIDFGMGTQEELIQVLKELTALRGLVGLNLSNNHLNGAIPDNIGNMTSLFSLDLSANELRGHIPPSIAKLTFLSHLNLSNNNLSGRIPTGNQLQTLIDPSIYAGNKGLCGAPLPKNCSNQEESTTTSTNKYEATHDEPKKWRHKLFVFAEETIDKIHVAVMVRVNKMKRGTEAM